MSRDEAIDTIMKSLCWTLEHKRDAETAYDALIAQGYTITKDAQELQRYKDAWRVSHSAWLKCCDAIDLIEPFLTLALPANIKLAFDDMLSQNSDDPKWAVIRELRRNKPNEYSKPTVQEKEND